MAVLEGPSRAAQAGETASLVIFLHGYGADGANLIELARPLAPYLPRTAFRAPNAPERCAMSPAGYQWFPIPWIDGSSERAMQEAFLRARDVLDRYLTEAMAEAGVTESETVLFGFSQGTMMALDLGPARAVALAGIVGFSGRVVDPADLKARKRTAPPVLLVHGEADPMIPVDEIHAARGALAAAGIPVSWHISPGTGHEIASDGLGLAARFLVDRLGQGGVPARP